MTRDIYRRIARAALGFRFGPKSMVAISAAASLAGAIFLYKQYQGVRSPAVKDFMTFYMGAKLVGTSGLYDERAGWAVQDKLVGTHSTMIPYVRPPFWAFLCEPLLLLPYSMALKVWYFVITLALVLFIWIFPANRLITLVVICWSEPVAANFFMGQDTVLLLVWIALGFQLNRLNKPLAAGAVLALCLAKFQFLTLLPILMLVQRRWRFAAGFGVGTVVLVAISFIVQGPHWPTDYFHELSHGYSMPAKNLMPDIRGAFQHSPYAVEIYFLGSVIVAVLLLVICLRTDFEMAFACCLVGALLVSPHVYVHDYALTLPLCILLLARVPNLLPIAMIFAMPGAYVTVQSIVFLSVVTLMIVAYSTPQVTKRAQQMRMSQPPASA